MTTAEYVVKLKSHLNWDEGMDDSMLSIYVQQGEKYVQNAVGREVEYLVIMCAGIYYEYRVAEKEMQEALDAMTPFFVQEVFSDAETNE
ncbi:head-tail connector protein [Jeotgalibacillus terrae]|uniref:Head-tail connector protein n=1 Tax=Jeotgalibacillus terrae TaxID=587735 RepID=A0ABW5ZH91_9BACL|nr:head-tail connector protein [Jeotgalibacillus terrae]MBM7577673.1 hypothetical protein [Jeotgalibacillus terrae]